MVPSAKEPMGSLENGKETVELGLVLKTLRVLDLSLETGLLKWDDSQEVIPKP